MSIAFSDRRSAVSVDELRRAWAAVQAGEFRQHRGATEHTRPLGPTGHRLVSQTGHGTGDLDRVDDLPASDRAPVAGWAPQAGERVLPVVGCCGSCGASTVAVALATAAGRTARVVECSSVTATGLAAAATAELGTDPAGWTQGSRGQVLLERVAGVLVRVEEVPAPSASRPGTDLTVLDVGWELGAVLATPSWLGTQVTAAATVVLVSTATVPGLRRLESALALLPGTGVCAAVLGPRRSKWPRQVTHTLGPLTAAVAEAGRLITIPQDRSMAVTGLDTAPIPPALLDAAAGVLGLTGTSTAPDPRPDPGPDARRTARAGTSRGAGR